MESENKVRVVFYLSPEVRELLLNQSKMLQINASLYVRNCVMEKLGKPIFEVKKKDLDVKIYTAQLLNIGNNLNQIAKKLNKGLNLRFIDQKKIADQIAKLNNHILEIKSKL